MKTTPVLRICLGIIKSIALVVPAARRTEWRAEWEAELHHRATRSGGSTAYLLLTRAIGSVRHALWLAQQEWRPGSVIQDIRYAFRVLRKNAAFSAIVIATIGLGIGASTAMFSVVYNVLLKPLPFDSPDGLVMVWEHNLPRNIPTNPVSGANYSAWKEDNTVFESMSAIAARSTTVLLNDRAERLGTVFVNQSFLPMLGVQPELGRTFRPDEDADGGPNVVIVSHRLWRNSLGGTEDVIGESITIGGDPYEIVGVLPAGFEFPIPLAFNFVGEQDIWLPMQLPADLSNQRGRWAQVVARLKPGVGVEAAQTQMTTLAGGYEQEFPDFQAGWTVNVVPLQAQIVGGVSTGLWLVFGAVACVLLISVVNVANLLLARSTARQQEMAVRTALGAGRTRVIRQMLTESTILSLSGGVVGVALSYLLLTTVVAVAPNLPRLDEIAVDWRVMLWAGLVSVGSGLLFGVIPAVRAARTEAGLSLSDGGARTGASVSLLRLRNLMVGFEIAVSVALLAGGGLLVRSFANLTNTGVGWDTGNLLTFQIQLPDADYPEAARYGFFDQLTIRLSAVPGVLSASAITFPPLAGSGSATSYWANDRAVPEPGQAPVADLKWVMPSYLKTTGLELVSGRFFDSRDTQDGELALVINRFTEEMLWPGESGVGKTISMPWGDTLNARIIGVVENDRYNGPSGAVRSLFYWSPRQFSTFNFMTVMARVERDPLSLAGSVRSLVSEIDPTLPVYNVSTMDSYFDATVARTRFAMLVLGVFSAIALGLAAIGIYGVMSYTVSQRRREMGIRMALGADAGALFRMVLSSGGRIILVSVTAGLAASLGLARLMNGLVFGVGTRDPVTLGAVAVGIAAVALFACLVPARRASRVPAAEAIRYE